MISPAKLLELESRFRFYIKLVNTPTNLWSWITHLLSIPKRYVISTEIASSSVGQPQRFTCKSLSLAFLEFQNCKMTKKTPDTYNCIIIYRKSSKNEHWWFKLSNWRKEKEVFHWFFNFDDVTVMLPYTYPKWPENWGEKCLPCKSNRTCNCISLQIKHCSCPFNE